MRRGYLPDRIALSESTVADQASIVNARLAGKSPRPIRHHPGCEYPATNDHETTRQRLLLARIEDPTGDDAEQHYRAVWQAGLVGVELALPERPSDDVETRLVAVMTSWAERSPVRALSLFAGLTDWRATAVVIEGWLRRAQALGAICVNISTRSMSTVGREPGPSAEAIHQTLLLLRHLRPTAESTGVAIGLEVGDDHPVSPTEVRELIDMVNTWAVGACVDASRLSPVAAADWLRTLHRRVTAVRVGGSLTGGSEPTIEVLDEIRFAGPAMLRRAAFE